MINKTRWHPDFCGCSLIFETDTEDANYQHCIEAEVLCDAHASLVNVDKDVIYTTLLEESRLRQLVLNTANERTPEDKKKHIVKIETPFGEIVREATEEEKTNGKAISYIPNEYQTTAEFGVDRKLIVRIPKDVQIDLSDIVAEKGDKIIFV